MAEKSETKGNKIEETRPVSGDAERVVPNVLWDDSKMTSTYANVCNVSSTREVAVFLE